MRRGANRNPMWWERRRRRGLTLIELMLSLAITGMIAAATTAMLTGLAQSVDNARGRRESMIRGQAVGVRIGAYVTPSLYFLDIGADSLVLWIEDVRDGDTVHASEVRWIDYDASRRLIRVQYVQFPDGMPQIERDIYDAVLPLSSDWWAELATYKNLGYTAESRLCDGVESFNTARGAGALSQRVVTFNVTFDIEHGGQTYASSAVLRDWREPTS